MRNFLWNDNVHTQLVHLLACHPSFTNLFITQFCHFGMYIHQFIHQPLSLSWNHVHSTNFPTIQLWHLYHPYVISSFMESLQMLFILLGGPWGRSSDDLWLGVKGIFPFVGHLIVDAIELWQDDIAKLPT
jgi:hypothetical protein